MLFVPGGGTVTTLVNNSAPPAPAPPSERNWPGKKRHLSFAATVIVALAAVAPPTAKPLSMAMPSALPASAEGAWGEMPSAEAVTSGKGVPDVALAAVVRPTPPGWMT